MLDHRALMGEFSASSLLNIFAIVTHKEKRSQGIATRLVEKCIKNAERSGLGMVCSVCTNAHAQVIKNVFCHAGSYFVSILDC